MSGVSDGELFQNAAYVGINLQDILYGIELVLYFRSMYSLLTHEGERNKSDVFYAIFSTLMLFMITIWVSTQAIFGEKIWLLEANFPESLNAYRPANISVWYMDIGTAAVTVLQLMTDALMIYRCRMIWNSYHAVIIPSILWVGTLGADDSLSVHWGMINRLPKQVLGILVIWTSNVPGGNFFSGVTYQLGLAYYSVTVFLTAMLTGSICFRVVWFGRTIKEYLGYEYASPYFAIVALVVESLLPCTLSGIAFLVSFGVGNQTSIGFACVYILLMCISPQMLILRVAMGRAWTKDTGKQPLSTINFSPREDMASESGPGGSGEVVHLQIFRSTWMDDDKV
ncbi:hypothetical protein J3R83DRAFT_3141 [Lanmaoa asiatica]|nr:hypothetical protein J3R83DRAFT_3141 [Lanmaoa asiatica]